MDIKDFRAEVKAAGEADGLAEGEFTALVSVFGNKDSVGDVVMPGAFTKSLEEWKSSGSPIPVIWAHDWSDPYSHIGSVTKAEETDRGLQVTATLDLENPKAQQVHRLLKGRRVTQFSFAYDVLDGGPREQKAAGDEDVYELRELKVHEVGPCLLGANQATELIAAKAAGLKAGRVLSTKNYASLKQAHETIGAVLDAAADEAADPKSNGILSFAEARALAGLPPTSGPDGSEKTDEPSSKTEPPADDDRPVGGKSDEAMRSATRRALAVARITQL